MQMLLLLASICLLSTVNGYCIINEANYTVWFQKHYVSRFKLHRYPDGKISSIVPALNSICCTDVISCTEDGRTSDNKWTHRTVLVSCHAKINIYTEVKMPIGGSLKIHANNQIAWIEVFGHLNDTLNYWYRCGRKTNAISINKIESFGK